MLDNIPIAIAIAGDLLMLTTAVGAVTCSLWMLPAYQATPQLHRRLWKLLGTCLLGFTVSSTAGLLLQTASISERSVIDALPMVSTVLFETHYGQLWLIRICAAIVTGIFWAWHWRRITNGQLIPYLSFSTLLVIIGTLSTASHSGDDGVFTLSNFANIVHISGGLLWGGGIITISLIVLPALRSSAPPAPATIANAILALSRLSAIALAMVIFSGIYNAWLQVGSWDALWATTYGRILLIKVGFVLLMMALGAHHRYAAVPTLLRWAKLEPPHYLVPFDRFFTTNPHEATPQAFQQTLRFEAVLLIIVLALAAMLSQQTPATHMEEESTM
ncbi:MAG: CopD family protein [Gammaproteobacteria bacterium]|nr:CopD family protein [Gammaproteobacteria bacterium]